MGHVNLVSVCVCYSHKPLQGPLLVDLIGAVGDVRIKVGLSMLANNVTNVVDHYTLLVSFLQLTKKPEETVNNNEYTHSYIATV